MALYNPKKPFRAQSATPPPVVNNNDASIRRLGKQAPPATPPPARPQGPDQAIAPPAPTPAAPGTLGGGRATQPPVAPDGTRGGSYQAWQGPTTGGGSYTTQNPTTRGDGSLGNYAGGNLGGGTSDPNNVVSGNNGGAGVEGGDVTDAVLEQIMGMIGDYDDEQSRIRAEGEQNLGGNLRAMGGQLGASGMGMSGAGVAMSGNVARQNELATQKSLQDAEEAFFKRLLGAQDAALGDRGMDMDESTQGILDALMENQLENEDPGDGYNRDDSGNITGDDGAHGDRATDEGAWDTAKQGAASVGMAGADIGHAIGALLGLGNPENHAEVLKLREDYQAGRLSDSQFWAAYARLYAEGQMGS